jgi:hypothetical protein
MNAAQVLRRGFRIRPLRVGHRFAQLIGDAGEVFAFHGYRLPGAAGVFQQERSLSLRFKEEQTGLSLHRQHFPTRCGMLESRESLRWSYHAFGSEHVHFTSQRLPFVRACQYDIAQLNFELPPRQYALDRLCRIGGRPNGPNGFS